MSETTRHCADQRSIAGVAEQQGGVARLEVTQRPGESDQETLARTLLDPCVHAVAHTAWFSESFGPTDTTATYHALSALAKRVHGGDMREVETSLVAQAVALNNLFTELSRRAALNIGKQLGATETYLRLALRAQNQSRMTLETLSTIKNPPVVFAKQANIAHGHQQVNNGEASSVARTPETSNRPTELLEAPHAKPEWMDTGAASTATRGNPAMAALEEIDRPTNA